MSAPTPIPLEVLELPVSGRKLDGERFADSLGTGATLLVFLRQLG